MKAWKARGRFCAKTLRGSEGGLGKAAELESQRRAAVQSRGRDVMSRRNDVIT